MTLIFAVRTMKLCLILLTGHAFPTLGLEGKKDSTQMIIPVNTRLQTVINLGRTSTGWMRIPGAPSRLRGGS